MIQIDFKIDIDNSDRIIERKNEALRAALEAVGLEAEKNAKMEITRKVYDVPQTPEQRARYKRTGLLRNSITHQVQGNTVMVGTNVEYAPYVELGTIYMHERPFIAPSIEEHLDEYKAIIERVLEFA